MSVELTLADFGWRSHYAQQVAAEPVDGAVPVRVLAVHRSALQVAAPGLNRTVELPPSWHAGPIAVGDWLLLNSSENRPVKLLERLSLFRRRAPGTDRSEQVIAANVDTLFVMSSCNQDFNEARLERYLAVALDAGVMPVIVLTKADLCNDVAPYVDKATRLSPGVVVETVSALQRKSLHCLDAWLTPGQTVALLGSSGVGKSTLSNTLLGSEQVATRAIRDDDAKGRHTTTVRQMHRLPSGAWLIDTPGMRELQLTSVKEGIESVFAEIADLAANCRFANCEHDGEPGCAVALALERGGIDESRVKRWRKLIREERHNRESLAERRARDKSTGRFYKQVAATAKARKGR